MKKNYFFAISLLITSYGISQEFEIGPMINYEPSSFNIPDSSFIVIGGPGGASEGSRTTGFEKHITFGGYAAYFFEDNVGVAAELFYQETSATEFGDNVFKSINFIPYGAFEFWNTNIFLNLGAGIGLMIDTPEFGEGYNVDKKDIKKFDIPVKAGFDYKIDNILTIGFGVHSSVTRVVKDEILRTHYYLGIKVPLNRILAK